MKAGVPILALALFGVSAAASALQRVPAHLGPPEVHATLPAVPHSPPATHTHAVQPVHAVPQAHSEHRLTLEQAVARVQNRTGGKVLKADSQNRGRIVEYRIKVLTPDGHVRVVTLRSDDHDAQ